MQTFSECLGNYVSCVEHKFALNLRTQVKSTLKNYFGTFSFSNSLELLDEKHCDKSLKPLDTFKTRGNEGLI